MENLNADYRLSLYIEIVELSKDKVYIVRSTLDDKIYIKKVLEIANYKIYSKLQKLSIKDIPKIYEIIKFDNKLIVIEEYINGYSIKEILDRCEKISKPKVIEYTLNIISILDELHSCTPAIIHRDIKPSNIMINNDGIAKLIDFDISRIHRDDKSTDTNILGTYGFASPEQFGFNQTDARTDIYSLGVTMNTMLTGELPIDELYKGKLSNTISKCIEIDPKKRFQNVSELKNMLLKKNKKYEGKKKNPNHVFLEKLPGFRSRYTIVKIFSSLGYIILILILLGVFDESFSKERKMNILLGVFIFIFILLYGNYNNIKSRIPILKSKNIFIQILGYIIYSFILLIILGSILPN